MAILDLTEIQRETDCFLKTILKSLGRNGASNMLFVCHPKENSGMQKGNVWTVPRRKKVPWLYWPFFKSSSETNKFRGKTGNVNWIGTRREHLPQRKRKSLIIIIIYFLVICSTSLVKWQGNWCRATTRSTQLGTREAEPPHNQVDNLICLCCDSLHPSRLSSFLFW